MGERTEEETLACQPASGVYCQRHCLRCGRDGDTFQFLGKEFDISWRKLVKYNDLHKEYTLEAGDIIYLKDKRKKAAKPHTVYIVKDGDSMHSISQKYGIRLKNLYKMNRKDAEYVPEVGDRLRLR